MPVTDANGNIIGLDQDSSTSNTDGARNAKNESIVLYNSGGPPDSTGIPTQQTFNRLRELFGKLTATATITATTAGDQALVCAAGAMKTVMPGQAVRLATGGITEYACVSLAYTPSATATSIPLQLPLVNTGNTIAIWDSFGNPALGLMQPTGMFPVSLVIYDNANVGVRQVQSANSDALSSNNTMAVAAVGYNGGGVSERVRSPNVFKQINNIAVTASTANTPTSIWTPTSGKSFRLTGGWFSVGTASGLFFHDLATVGGGGVIVTTPRSSTNTPFSFPPIGNGWLSAAANNQLWLDANVATNVVGMVWGVEE